MEKSRKGILVACSAEFPHTHNIGRLKTLLNEVGFPLPEELDPVLKLTDYATTARYPGPWGEIDHALYEEPCTLAEAAINWAELVITKRFGIS